METGTFPHKSVQDKMKRHFVGIKYKTGIHADQYARFDVRATPTYVILDSEGNELHRIVGFLLPNDFIRKLDEILKTE